MRTRYRAPRLRICTATRPSLWIPATGKLAWYYQHLPADDWDSDYTHERTLVHTKFNPDPKFVKWINPGIKPGEERDIAVTIGEAGGVFALDRATGQFLWATPFPFDDPHNRDLQYRREVRQDRDQLE